MRPVKLADSVNQLNNELDGVDPIDNMPSTDELHRFVQKKKIIIIIDM